MNSTVKIIIGIVILAIIGGLALKAVSLAIGLAIVVGVGYFVIKMAYPQLLESGKNENQEPPSPLEKYKDR